MTQIERLPDWAERFTNFLLESQQEGLKCDWEFFHCASWVGAGVEALTEVDLYEPIRAFDTSSPTLAYKAMKKAGFDSMEEYLATRLEEKPIVFAQRGDIVLAAAGPASDLTVHYSELFPAALGLADPPYYWGISELGVGRAPLLEAHKCFGVGVS